MNDLVSIIIPAYNAEKYISETIESVLQQTHTNWELIIIDDGSDDRTPEVVKEYLEDKRIIYIRQENMGVSSARNRGIELARGDYLAFLDADDVWLRNNLKAKLLRCQLHPEIDWVFSDMEIIDENSNFLSEAEHGTDKDLLDNILLWESEVVPGICSNILLKKRCIEQGVRFHSSFSTAADQDFCIQLAARFKGAYIPETLFRYRHISDSMSKNIHVMQMDHIGVYLKARKENLFFSKQFERRCFSNLYFILAGSWWVNKRNYFKGMLFLIRALILYPANVKKLIKKLKYIPS